jgi:hypothetical protein
MPGTKSESVSSGSTAVLLRGRTRKTSGAVARVQRASVAVMENLDPGACITRITVPNPISYTE